MVTRSHLAGGVFAALIAGAAVLSFADRAPDIVFPLVASVVGAAEGATGVDLVGRGGFPFEYDAIGHVVLWFSLAVASWWTFRHRIPLAVQGLALFAASSIAEVGQMYFTSSRISEPRDLAANAIGIAGGLAVGLAIDAAEPLVRGRPPARVRVE